MSQNPPWMHPADETILADLRCEQPDYIPLVANRLGMHLPYVEARCEHLIEYGLLDSVTNEAVYAVTDRGEAYLAGELDHGELVDSE